MVLVLIVTMLIVFGIFLMYIPKEKYIANVCEKIIQESKVKEEDFK